MGIVGKNCLAALIALDRGSSARGKAWFKIRLPPDVIEEAPSKIVFWAK